MAELTPQQVDVILYNLRTWRRLVSLIEPRTSTSVVVLPVATRSPSSSVERVAVCRAVVSEVLDSAEEALRMLPQALKSVARMRYVEQMSLREIARELTRRKRKAARRRGREAEPISKTWVGTQVDLIREHCTRHLTSVSEEFWCQIRTLELRNRGQKA